MSSKILKAGTLILILFATSASALGKKEKSLLKFLLCPPIPIPTPNGNLKILRPGSKSKTIHLPKPIIPSPRIITPPLVVPTRRHHSTNSSITVGRTYRHTCPPPPPRRSTCVVHPTVIMRREVVREPKVIIVERPVREVVVEETVVDESPSMIEPPSGCSMTGTVVEDVIMVDECPPARVRELKPRCPAPNLVWTPGHWVRRHNAWCWSSGYWRRPPARHTCWKPGKWVSVGKSWQWRKGCWK